MLAEEDILKQIGELATIPVKNYFEVRNIRKNMLANYSAKMEIELMNKIMSSEKINTETKVFYLHILEVVQKSFLIKLKF